MTLKALMSEGIHAARFKLPVFVQLAIPKPLHGLGSGPGQAFGRQA